jgi:hypothetical protein
MTPARKSLWIAIGIVIGGFVGFWTAFALFFTYPEPLGVWAHPFVWAAGGAAIGRSAVLSRSLKAVSAIHSRPTCDPFILIWSATGVGGMFPSVEPMILGAAATGHGTFGFAPLQLTPPTVN